MKLGFFCSKSLDTSRFKDVKSEKFAIMKNVIFLSLGFTLLFTAFNSMSALQSSVNRDDGRGTASLTAIYIALIISCIFVPSIVIQRLTVKWTMCVCVICYSTYIAAQFYPQFYTLIPTGLLLGFAAAPLWIAKCKYITKIGARYAELTNQKSEHILVKFFGIFFLIFQTHAVWGNLISSTVLQPANTITLNDDIEVGISVCGANFCPHKEEVLNATGKNFEVESWQIYTLSSTYLIASFLGALLIALAVDPLEWFISSKDNDENKKATLTGFQLLAATFNQLKNPNQLLILPISVWSGFEKGFFSSDFTAGYISCSWGVSKVGYVLICYGVCNSICSYVSGSITKAVGSRIPIFILGASINISLIITMFLWGPNPDESYVFFVIAGMWGMSSAIWQTQINSFYGVVFKGQEEAAFSNHRLWESLGFVISYIYHNSICMHVKLYNISSILFLGMLGYCLVEIRMRMNPHIKAKSKQESGV